MKSKINVGDNITTSSTNWTFSGKTAKNFTSHAVKSIPYYKDGHDLILEISDYFLNKNSKVLDIGCSNGDLLNQLKNRHKNKKGLELLGIDNEKDMLQVAKKKFKNIKFFHKDADKFSFNKFKFDLIISYYTMQFIHPSIRQKIFDKIYKSLNWGGGFIIYEKVRGPDARFQDMQNGIYNEFKIKQGFTKDEIINKTISLKGVLEPFSKRGNEELFKRAGFKDFMVVHKWVCFQGWILIK